MSAPGNGTGRWRQARRNPKVVTGVAILIFFGLVVVAHPVLQSTIWAGEDRLYDALFERIGAIRVHRYDDLIDVSLAPLPGSIPMPVYALFLLGLVVGVIIGAFGMLE